MTMTYTSADLAFTEENIAKWQAEELDPEFEPYVSEHELFGRIIRHPLVIDVPATNLNGFNNLRLRIKKAKLAELVAEKNWGGVLVLYERGYRLDALYKYVLKHDLDGEVLPLWEQPKSVRKHAQWVWTDSENINQNREEWLHLYRDRPEGAVLGNLKEFRKLPEKVELFRGGGEQPFLSWTTDRSIAEFFSGRLGNGEGVHSITVDKRDIFAYYTSRGESEALVFTGQDR